MLTKKKKQILDYIKRYIKKHDYSPSLEEMAEHFKLVVSTIHQHIDELKRDGYLDKLDNQPRTIQISENKKSRDLVEIPLLGVIAAGQPIEAIENPEVITIPKIQLSKHGEYYALKAQGDSMIDDGIFDGDIVVIKKQPTANNGQTVVAVIDENEATLKRFYKEKGRIRLQPANQSMLPIYRKEVEIRGIVIQIIRNLENENLNDFATKKKIFLASIKSNNVNSHNEYKRVIETPLRYAGGKSLAVGYVVELLSNNIKRLISPFFGGGSVEIACNKYLGLKIIGYEIFDILVNYWNVQINNPEALYNKLYQFKPNKSAYEEVKEKLKAHWKNQKKLNSLDLAAHYYFNHNLSYGPGFLGWPSRVYLNQERYKTMIERVRDFSVKDIEIRCASFEEAFKKYPNDFFYCDPPYFLGGDSKMFRGIYPMRNIPIHHNNFDHEELRNLLKKHKGGFVLSYNDCSTIRNWYSEFKQSFPKWQYTMGQGETRIGENRINGNHNHIKESHEILIYCPPKK